MPCAKVVGLAAGASTKVLIGGQPALLGTAAMITNGVPVSAPARVQHPGQTTVNAGS